MKRKGQQESRPGNGFTGLDMSLSFEADDDDLSASRELDVPSWISHQGPPNSQFLSQSNTQMQYTHHQLQSSYNAGWQNSYTPQQAYPELSAREASASEPLSFSSFPNYGSSNAGISQNNLQSYPTALPENSQPQYMYPPQRTMLKFDREPEQEQRSAASTNNDSTDVGVPANLVHEFRNIYDQPVRFDDEGQDSAYRFLLKGRKNHGRGMHRSVVSMTGSPEIPGSPRSRNNGKILTRTKHRRVQSDIQQGGVGAGQQHPLLKPALKKSRSFSRENLAHRRRLSSSEAKGLPPVAPSSKGIINHRRTSSRGSTADSYRRRADSVSSAMSISSSMTVGSYVTDITKSALFRGVSESGVANFHLPKDSFHIVMDPQLHPGSVYKVSTTDENEKFINYFLVASGGDWQDLIDDLDEEHGTACQCHCDQCANCTNRKNDLLPNSTYALSVEDDLYQRVLKEVSDSHRMPCGIFFCGHHEDVDKPSIKIALAIVCALFLGMATVAFCTSDLV